MKNLVILFFFVVFFIHTEWTKEDISRLSLRYLVFLLLTKVFFWKFCKMWYKFLYLFKCTGYILVMGIFYLTRLMRLDEGKIWSWKKTKQINKWKWNKNIQYFYRYFIKFSVFVDNGKATPSTTDARCIKILGLGWEWYVKKKYEIYFYVTN